MPNEINNPIHIPQVTVQSDWVEVISDVLRGTVVSESFWVSCYRKGTAHSQLYIILYALFKVKYF